MSAAAAVLISGLEVARIGVDLLTKKRSDHAAATLEIASHLVKLIPVADLRAYLDEADRLAIDAAAEVAKEIKLAEENQP